VFIALPDIGRDLSLTPAVLAWVAGAFAVTFGGFVILGGRIADRVGLRRLFLLAVAAFGLTSGIGALASTAPVLLAARAGQGMAAAILQPSIVGLMQTLFPAEPVRGRAWGVWAGVGAGGLAAGALLGGLLTALSWRWTFAINLPLMAACALGARTWITAWHHPSGSRRIPLRAAVLGTGTALSAALGLTLGGLLGWTSPAPPVCAAATAVLGTGFWLNDRDPDRALIDPALRRVPSLWLGAGVTALYMASVGSAYYLLTLLLQDQWGYSALRSGLGFLPRALTVTAGSAAAPAVTRRLGPRAALAVGFGLGTAGLGWLAATADTISYPLLLAGLLVSGVGNGIVFTAMFDLGTRGVPRPPTAPPVASLPPPSTWPAPSRSRPARCCSQRRPPGCASGTPSSSSPPWPPPAPCSPSPRTAGTHTDEARDPGSDHGARGSPSAEQPLGCGAQQRPR